MPDYRPSRFPNSWALSAGYDTSTHYYLRVTHTEGQGRVLGIVRTDNGGHRELPDSDLDTDGVCAQDLGDTRTHADFRSFEPRDTRHRTRTCRPGP